MVRVASSLCVIGEQCLLYMADIDTALGGTPIGMGREHDDHRRADVIEADVPAQVRL